MTLDDLEEDVLEWVPLLRWFTNQQSLSHNVKKNHPSLQGIVSPLHQIRLVEPQDIDDDAESPCPAKKKVSLCYACGDQASSYCHIKWKNFPALLQGIVAHITKYVQGAKKRLTMITRM